ncbi:hypothetical protein ABZZ74_53185 [Streptomyces sp. NPDC006476]|uniref:hypothetical protein n=1 Tax=Streptomyces sp. NPDC006476 TaxID=3157175 RepID=UPI0033B3B891
MLNVRRWERIVAAWVGWWRRGPGRRFGAWVDLVVDLGSQWGQYEYVTNVGFAA